MGQISHLDTQIVTAAEFKAFRKVQGTEDDALIAILVSQISGWVSTWCGRKFEQASYDLTYDGNGSRFFFVDYWPVTVGTVVLWQDGLRKWADSTKLIEDTSTVTGDFLVHPGENGGGKIERLGGRVAALGADEGSSGSWILGSRVIRVQYQAGYPQATIPGPVKWVANVLLSIEYDLCRDGTHGVRSQRLPTGSGSEAGIISTAMPERCEQVLASWRRD